MLCNALSKVSMTYDNGTASVLTFLAARLLHPSAKARSLAQRLSKDVSDESIMP